MDWQAQTAGHSADDAKANMVRMFQQAFPMAVSGPAAAVRQGRVNGERPPRRCAYLPTWPQRSPPTSLPACPAESKLRDLSRRCLRQSNRGNAYDTAGQTRRPLTPEGNNRHRPIRNRANGSHVAAETLCPRHQGFPENADGTRPAGGRFGRGTRKHATPCTRPKYARTCRNPNNPRAP